MTREINRWQEENRVGNLNFRVELMSLYVFTQKDDCDHIYLCIATWGHDILFLTRSLVATVLALDHSSFLNKLSYTFFCYIANPKQFTGGFKKCQCLAHSLFSVAYYDFFSH